MDMHTLHIEHAVLLGLFTVLTIVNSLLHREMKGVGWYPMYTFYAFLGAVLVALRGDVPDWASLTVGSLFFPLAYVFLHRWVTEFFGGRAQHSALQLGLACGALLALVKYGMLTPDVRYRMGIYSVVLALQLSVSAGFLFRHARGSLRGSGWMMAGLMTVLAANYLVRAAGLTMSAGPKDYLDGGVLVSCTLLATSVLQGALTIAFVWVTAAGLRQELEVQASTDPLTGLLNRRAIGMVADREIAISELKKEPLSAVLIDLDDFKQINDSYGHQQGDAVLQAVARCLSANLRASDNIARLGGDEFVVLLPNTKWETASRIAESLRACLEDTECVLGERVTRVRASFGVAELRGQEPGWEQLMMSCDRALYAVKEMGGNQVLVH